MINRDNWKLVNLYIAYRRDVDLISASSQRLEKTWLSHVLSWLDSSSFLSCQSFRPSFPQYLRSMGLSFIYTSHVIRSARRFFLWLSKHQKGYSFISSAWLDTLKVPSMVIEHREHEAVTIDEIKAIAGAPTLNFREDRIQASCVFWFLSGIRVGAFVSLPYSAVDLDNLTVKQWPKLGVRTKFTKHATTYLLDIPELLFILERWAEFLRLSNSLYWFPLIDPDTGNISDHEDIGIHRASIARRDLRGWLSRVGLPYHSPHKFRHGHAVYALKQAKDIPALKAISQNLMHSNLSITDGVYGVLSDMDVKKQIQQLGK